MRRWARTGVDLVTDGGREMPSDESGESDDDGTFPDDQDPEATAFRWGPDPEEPAESTGRGDDLAALRADLATLEDLARSLQVHAMNAQLQVARQGEDEVSAVTYDVEADARRVARTVEDAQRRLDRLEDRLQLALALTGEQETETGTGDSTEGEPAERETGRRASVQLPAGDREPVGPWRVAGVDLTRWPGRPTSHDFDHLRSRVPRSETVATGRIPGEVARFALEDDELTFEQVLALATAEPPGTEGDD